jgi:hypothetical protein
MEEMMSRIERTRAIMGIKAHLLNIIYGKRVLVETVAAPGTIIILMGIDKRIHVTPLQSIFKRPRQNYTTLSGVYLHLPFSIPVAHIIHYDASLPRTEPAHYTIIDEEQSS